MWGEYEKNWRKIGKNGQENGEVWTKTRKKGMHKYKNFLKKKYNSKAKFATLGSRVLSLLLNFPLWLPKYQKQKKIKSLKIFSVVEKFPNKNVSLCTQFEEPSHFYRKSKSCRRTKHTMDVESIIAGCCTYDLSELFYNRVTGC